MSSAGRQSFSRILLVFFTTACVFLFVRQYRPGIFTMSKDPLSHLSVSVRKSASHSLTFGVTNNHDTPITILKWESPLDLSALKIGTVKLFAPADSDDALDFPTIQIRRKMPPGKDQLVTIGPGETKENSVELDVPFFPIDQLKGDVKVTCKGRWVSAWQKTADQISPKELEDLNAGDEALSGEFEMEPATINF